MLIIWNLTEDAAAAQDKIRTAVNALAKKCEVPPGLQLDATKSVWGAVGQDGRTIIPAQFEDGPTVKSAERTIAALTSIKKK